MQIWLKITINIYMVRIMNKVFVDTGGWVGLFNKRDKFHLQAQSIYKDIKSNKFLLLTSDYVIDEALTLIRMRRNAEVAIQFGEALFNSKIANIINVNSDLFYQSWLNFKKFQDKSFSFTDVTTLTLMQTMKIKFLFGFDEQMFQTGLAKNTKFS